MLTSAANAFSWSVCKHTIVCVCGDTHMLCGCFCCCCCQFTPDINRQLGRCMLSSAHCNSDICGTLAIRIDRCCLLLFTQPFGVYDSMIVADPIYLCLDFFFLICCDTVTRLLMCMIEIFSDSYPYEFELHINFYWVSFIVERHTHDRHVDACTKCIMYINLFALSYRRKKPTAK